MAPSISYDLNSVFYQNETVLAYWSSAGRPEMPCRFCGIVNTICYWGGRSVKPWKRPLLFIASVPFLAGGLAYAWVMVQQQSVAGTVLGLIVLAISAGGIVISLRGCDDCVARFFGDF
jgi:hypothetical protein